MGTSSVSKIPADDFVQVAFDRGEAHVEGAGRLGIGHPASYGGDYLSSEVF
jgi:hypothetical protein